MLHAIQIVLMASQWTFNKRQVELLLNVLVSAVGPDMSLLLSAVRQGLDFISSDLKFSLKDVCCFILDWITSKLDFLLAKGIVFSDIDEVKTLAIDLMHSQ
jgi:hypothetical protein